MNKMVDELFPNLKKTNIARKGAKTLRTIKPIFSLCELCGFA